LKVIDYHILHVYHVVQNGATGKAKISNIKKICIIQNAADGQKTKQSLVVCPKSILAPSSYQVNISSSGWNYHIATFLSFWVRF